MIKKMVIPKGQGTIDSLLMLPPKPLAAFVFAHGAGAGMTHPFLEKLAVSLHDQHIATLRFQFPYMQQGRKLPDKEPILLETVEASLAWMEKAYPSLPLFAGGKSMGGRMTSLLLSQRNYPNIMGLIFLGFPLHPSRKPSRSRADHLLKVPQRMLFLQGTRDALSSPPLITSCCNELGPKARLYWIKDADHSFQVLKKSGRTLQETHHELVQEITEWIKLQVS